jgi:LmbE family N-acetylglucosaminyl deacetylase
MAHLAAPLGEDELRRPAMVFAPHPDDETLGCGGTLLRKRRAGAAVWVVFLTDGAASHAHLVPRAELRGIRAGESLAAVEVLGVQPPRVSWLDFPDGELARHRAEAVSRVSALLEQHGPEQLFVPYARGEHPDHVATHAIVYEALARARRPATILEYPVWSWRRSGLRLLVECRTSVSIQELLTYKREALARHASQVERRGADPRWRTLGDVDEGEFLACFFQGHEFYRRVDVTVRP